jgi:DNA-binding Lrp family transcriptional regulator
MKEALQGQLSEGVLANLLQYLAMNQVSGCLTVRHPEGLQGYLFFEQGRLIHISLGTPGKLGVLKDTAALSVMLNWQQGRFAFRDHVESPVHSIDKSLQDLLLSAAQQLDEKGPLEPSMLSAESVLCAKTISEKQEWLVLNVAALRILSHLNGVQSLAEIANQLALPLEHVLRAAADLVQQGLVEEKAALVNPSFVAELTQVLVYFIGPMAEIVVDDTLYELNVSAKTLPKRSLAEFVRELSRQLKRDDWQRDFRARARLLAERYELVI